MCHIWCDSSRFYLNEMHRLHSYKRADVFSVWLAWLAFVFRFVWLVLHNSSVLQYKLSNLDCLYLSMHSKLELNSGTSGCDSNYPDLFPLFVVSLKIISCDEYLVLSAMRPPVMKSKNKGIMWTQKHKPNLSYILFIPPLYASFICTS